MHNFTKIYLDMDGVIADFEKRYRELFHTSPGHDDNRKRFGIRFAKFIQFNHFADLDMMPDATDLLTYLTTTGVPVEILSSTARPTSNATISQQKRSWLDNYGINYPAIFVPGKQFKAKYATPNSILIDDTLVNIEEWNKAGGVGILHKNALDTISILNTLLGG
jgi:hypothetical protein